MLGDVVCIILLSVLVRAREEVGVTDLIDTVAALLQVSVLLDMVFHDGRRVGALTLPPRVLGLDLGNNLVVRSGDVYEWAPLLQLAAPFDGCFGLRERASGGDSSSIAESGDSQDSRVDVAGKHVGCCGHESNECVFRMCVSIGLIEGME